MKRRPASITAIVALVVTLAACGNGDDTGDDVASLGDTDSTSEVEPDSTTETEELTPEEAAIEFAACMRDQGIDMPDPEFSDEGGVIFEGRTETEGDGGAPSLSDSRAMEDAFDECGDIMEGAGIGPGADGPDRAEMEDRVLEFAQCMRDEGVDMPDPDFDSPPDEGLAATPSGGAVGPVIGGPFGTLDLGDPDVAAAFESCQDIMGMPDLPLAADGEE